MTPDLHFILGIALIFILLTLLLAAAAFFSSYQKKKYLAREKSIKDLIDNTISEHLLDFMETGEAMSEGTIPAEIVKAMRHRFNRNVMIAELVTARKNFSGKAGESIQRLYEQFELDHDSARKLNSSRWHIRALAVQELSMMQQKKYWKAIYKLTNHSNEYVRMEAQAGVIRLLGFTGLRFLNITSYEITEWQQINLLQLLKDIPGHDFQGMNRWLSSSNPSVVVFTLKMVADFQRYELLDEVQRCREDLNPRIQYQAIKTFRSLIGEDDLEPSEINV